MPLRQTLRRAIFAGLVLILGVAKADERAALPPALRGVNPDMLSGGLFTALDASGAYGFRLPPARARAGAADLSKGRPPAVLDPRVGANLSVGADPAALPAAQRGQAEPHVYRSPADPDLLLATFQDGRFSVDGGALDNGYAVSRDGGLTWTRSLVPQLTVLDGGPYFRATDPVAAGGAQGELYLNALASIDNAFGRAAVVVSRSTDQGSTWSPPFVVFQSPNGQTSPDKNWIAANDYPAAPNSGRIVVTWTNFTSNAGGASTGNNLVAAASDDGGETWSAPVAITPVGSSNQGTQPVFLPDGSLAVVYITFLNPAATVSLFSIQCKRSLDGGRTFPATAANVVSVVSGWDDPQLRDGIFLPSATVARQSGEIFVCYTALVLGSPRVMVTKSADQGATWSTPIPVSDQPAGVSVANPAIAVTPDGRSVSVVFIDKRHAPGGQDFIDHYAAQSFDGGVSWQPNLRLSEMSGDLRFGTPTSRGYMLGDYLGVAPALAADQPCVAIWCDTRTGDSDPMTVRFTPDASADFRPWQVARFTRAELAEVAHSGPAADPDADGAGNYVEFDAGTNPRVAESGETLVLKRTGSDSLDIACVARALSFNATELAVDPIPAEAPDPTTLPSAPTAASIIPAWVTDGIPSPDPGPGRVWRVARVSGIAGRALSVTRYGTHQTFDQDSGQTPPPVISTTIVASREHAVTGTNARLINLSTRGQLLADASQLIGSLVTRGTERTLLVRGVGPTLGQIAPTLNVAANPAMRFLSVDGTGLIENDDWSSTDAATRQALIDAAVATGAFPLTQNSDAALVVTGRGPGAYSAQVTNRATTGGAIGLVEIYDATTQPGGEMVNLSTRGEVGAGDAALIAGVVIRGTQPRRLLIRGIGPTLVRFGVPGALLADPVLTLFRGQTELARNDDWEISRSAAALAATAVNVGAFALDPGSLDAAVLVTLAPGGYTAIVTSADGGTGIALVEIYDID